MTSTSAARPETVPVFLRRVPPFPPVASRLLQLLSGPQASFREAADLVRSDPAFAGAVLRMANSPLVGCRHEVVNILQALSLLGLDRIGSLATSLGVHRLVGGLRTLPLMQRCWRHSIATALLAEEWGPEMDLPPDHGYMAGLLHDIGRLALLGNDPDEYGRVLERAAQAGTDERDGEREAFGIDHGKAGEWLAAQWGLPASLALPIARQHDAPEGRAGALARLVHRACHGAKQAGFGVLPGAADASGELDEATVDRLTVRLNAVECSLG